MEPSRRPFILILIDQRQLARGIVDQSIEEVHQAIHKRAFHVTTGYIKQFMHVVRWGKPEDELDWSMESYENGVNVMRATIGTNVS